MKTCVPGSIVLVAFPFSDGSTKKVRPAVVVAKGEYEDILVAAVSSSSVARYHGVLLTANMCSPLLPVTSWVRYKKLFTIHGSLVLRHVGILSKEGWQAIHQHVLKYVEGTSFYG